MTSSNITRLNLGKRNLHWCTLGAAVSRQLITTCVCANMSNKYTSQYRVLFRVQQHTTIRYSGDPNTDHLKSELSEVVIYN